MNGLIQKLSVALLAGSLGACAGKIKKADIPPTAVPSEEISRMDSDINAAYDAQYDVLAPKEFRKAQSWLKEAKEDMASGEGQAEILSDIGYARAYLDKAKETTEARQAKFQPILDARKVAINAGAKNFPAERKRMGELDDRFRDVADESSISTERFNKLQNAYLDLELGAIQATQLDAARARLAGARRDGAASNVPKTLKQAELDLTNAYNMVAAHRHNEDGYKAAVDKANFTTQLLVDALASSKQGSRTLPEDVAVERVMQGRQLAQVKGELSESEREKQKMGQALSKQEQQLSQAENQARLDAALEEARKEFSRDEADVYRQGDRLLIRLKGMHFSSGRSDLPQQSLSVLSKVKGIAEDLNPQQVLVEGHTDATGSAAVNAQLSQKRAEAVAEYLQTTGIEKDKLQAVGRGYEEPITSNKTKAGRAQNRRVDVIIVPSPAQGQQQQPQSM